jgi:hypothetical protein
MASTWIQILIALLLAEEIQADHFKITDGMDRFLFVR